MYKNCYIFTTLESCSFCSIDVVICGKNKFLLCKIGNIHLSLCSSKIKGFPVYQHTILVHSSGIVVGEENLKPVASVLLESLQNVKK